MNFKEQLEALKNKVKGMITNDLSTEQVKAYGDLVEDIDKVGDDHQELVKEHSELKELYIKSVKNYVTSEKPKNETENTGKSFEEIMSEIEKESTKG